MINALKISGLAFVLSVVGLTLSFGQQCSLPRANMKALQGKLNPCLGDSVIMEAAFRPANVQYQWFKDGIALLGATNPVYKAVSNGDYHFVYRNNTCQSEFFDKVRLNYKTILSVNAPVLTLVNPPVITNCYNTFTISSNASPSDTMVWLSDGVPVPGASGVNFSGISPGIYQLMVISAGGCRALSAPRVVQVNGSDTVFIPRIDTASVVNLPDSQRCEVSWRFNNPRNPLINHVKILREKDGAPGEFELAGKVQLAGDTNSSFHFLDSTSKPWKRPYYYRLQPQVQCGSDSFLAAPSKWHKCIHLQHSKNSNLFHLFWTPYEGFQLDSFRIRCLDSAGLLVRSFMLPSSVTSKTLTADEVPPSVVKFQMEGIAKATDQYQPWGRINADVPRKTKSNTRPIIQSIPGGDSTSIFNADVVITSVRAVKKAAMEFNIFPSPSGNGGGDVFASSGIQKAEVFDLQGRKQEIMVEEMASNHWKLWLPASAENGLYFVRVYSGGGNLVKPWLLQR